MAFLKSGEPVVVDSHVLAEAARQERDGEVGSELAFVNALIERCPRVVLSPRQRSSDQTRGELVSALHKRGFRFPELSGLIARLGAGERREAKLKRLSRSEVPEFPEQTRVAFLGAGGHDDVSDDVHLYEAAVAKGTVVVTLDGHLLDRAGDLLKQTGVQTLAPSAVLELWAEEAE